MPLLSSWLEFLLPPQIRTLITHPQRPRSLNSAILFQVSARHWQPELFWDTFSAVDATFGIRQEHVKDPELAVLDPFSGSLVLSFSVG